MAEAQGKDEQSRKRNSGPKRLLSAEATVSILTVLLVVVIWYYFTDSIIPKLFFPSPLDTVHVVGRMEGVLVEYFIATMYRVVVGMLAGAILGVLVRHRHELEQVDQQHSRSGNRSAAADSPGRFDPLLHPLVRHWRYGQAHPDRSRRIHRHGGDHTWRRLSTFRRFTSWRPAPWAPIG